MSESPAPSKPPSPSDGAAGASAPPAAQEMSRCGGSPSTTVTVANATPSINTDRSRSPTDSTIDTRGPLEMATAALDEFVASLQFPPQKVVLGNFGRTAITEYDRAYRERERILKTSQEGAWTRNCKVSFPFQPNMEVKDGPAHKAFAARAATFKNQVMAKLALLTQEGAELNLKGINDMQARTLLAALPSIAALIMTIHSCNSASYGKHDLVADLICNTQPEILTWGAFNHIKNIKDLVCLYKTVNNITTEPESLKTVYDRYFPNDEPPTAGPDQTNPNAPTTTTPANRSRAITQNSAAPGGTAAGWAGADLNLSPSRCTRTNNPTLLPPMTFNRRPSNRGAATVSRSTSNQGNSTPSHPRPPGGTELTFTTAGRQINTGFFTIDTSGTTDADGSSVTMDTPLHEG